jgi:hypothetical protein
VDQKRNAGSTFVEILVVVRIFGILAAIVIFAVAPRRIAADDSGGFSSILLSGMIAPPPSDFRERGDQKDPAGLVH